MGIIFDEIATFLRESARQFGNCSENYASYALGRLEICITNVSRLNDHLENGMELVQPENRDVIAVYKNSVGNLAQYLEEWQKYISAMERISESLRFRVATSDRPIRGRPQFIISKEQLEYLHSMSFSWTSIASLFGVSRMTIFRRREEFGLINEPDRTLTDSELTNKVSDIKNTRGKVNTS